MRRIDKVTSKRTAIMRQKQNEPNSYERVVAQVEIALWKANYKLPITTEIPVTANLNSEFVKRVSRVYEDAGYTVLISEEWPQLIITIS